MRDSGACPLDIFADPTTTTTTTNNTHYTNTLKITTLNSRKFKIVLEESNRTSYSSSRYDLYSLSVGVYCMSFSAGPN